MKRQQSFKDFIAEATQLDESSWLSKGFAAVQGAKHEQTRQKLNALASKLKGTAHKGTLEHDLEKRNDLLFEAVEMVADGFALFGELSRCNINVAVATNLLEEDIRKTIETTIKGIGKH